MGNKFSIKEKEQMISEFRAGSTAAELCAQYNVPRSTLYLWIHQNKQIKSYQATSVTLNDDSNLERRVAKLEKQLEVIKATGCGTGSPLDEKLKSLEKIYAQGKYSVHVLCDALEVSRGTFYNHIFRR